jgi:hypothetical protein
MTARRTHLILAVAWALLIAPTLFYWPDSIRWVAFMSLYANIAGHWSAFEGAKAEEAAEGS